MYLCYIDESGKPHRSDPTEFFGLSAFILNEQEWKSVDAAVDTVKQKFFPLMEPRDVELHARDIIHENDIFKTLGHNVKYELLRDCYELIGKTNCTIISVLIRKARMREYVDIELWAHRLLFERLNKFLDKQTEDPKEYGLMFIDTVEKRYDLKTRKKIIGFCDHGTKYYKGINYILEHPVFVHSDHCNMSQLADLVAFCSNRKHTTTKKPNITDKNNDEYFERIYPKFDMDSTGKVEGCGLKIFPG